MTDLAGGPLEHAHERSHTGLTAAVRQVLYDILLYVSNHIVTRIPSHTLRLWFYRRCLRLEIESGSYIFLGAWIDTRGNFQMKRNSVINQGCRLDNRGGIFIGENVSVAAEACILTADHDLGASDNAGRVRPVIIEDFAFVGTRAMILPGVTIGKGAVVAAGAVVTRTVKPYSIVAGVPAREIGQRRQDLDYCGKYCRLFA